MMRAQGIGLFLIGLVATVTLFGANADAGNSRRIAVSCETSLFFRQLPSAEAHKRIAQWLNELEALLVQYTEAGEYFAIAQGSTQNLPTEILDRAGMIESTLKTLDIDSEDARQSQKLMRDFWLAIYRPYAELQVAMSDGIDPDSKAGTAFLSAQYVQSLTWLNESGWRVETVRELIDAGFGTNLNRSRPRARRIEIMRDLVNLPRRQ